MAGLRKNSAERALIETLRLSSVVIRCPEPNRESAVNKAVDHTGEVLHASRPGMKTLYGFLAALALFILYRFWEPLKATFIG
jgi:hypothetical protein